MGAPKWSLAQKWMLVLIRLTAFYTPRDGMRFDLSTMYFPLKGASCIFLTFTTKSVRLPRTLRKFASRKTP